MMITEELNGNDVHGSGRGLIWNTVAVLTKRD
jgi:hypothetical protein